jgi:S1-C subfamily serine protease
MRGAVALVLALAACTSPRIAGPQDSVVPGTIGVLVHQKEGRVIVAAVGKTSPAAEKGVSVGDVVLRYNGEPVASARQFNRLVVDSPPGSLVRLELLRGGEVRTLEVPVEQLDTIPRV